MSAHLALVHCTCIVRRVELYLGSGNAVVVRIPWECTMLENRTRDRFGRLMKKDRAGRRYGRWTVVHYIGAKRWLCRCDCGIERPVRGTRLDAGCSQSCGCLAREVAGALLRTHGMSHTPTYKSWTHMLDRCRNPHHHAAHLYSKQGIIVCKRWQHFENFLEDMGLRPSLLYSIDRFPDPAGNYAPDNCRWATAAQQGSNTRSNRMITWRGVTLTLSDWARRLDLCATGLNWRLKNWPLEKALTEAVRPYPSKRH